MMHNNLLSYYERIFAFRQYHNWSISELENLMPWEMEVMMTLLTNYLEKLGQDKKAAMNAAKSL